jgi:hypothetical protein
MGKVGVDLADVMAAVGFGVSNEMLTAIRGGGHNGAGLGVCDDGLVIDLSRMKGKPPIVSNPDLGKGMFGDHPGAIPVCL